MVTIERVQLDTKTHSVDGQQLEATIQNNYTASPTGAHKTYVNILHSISKGNTHRRQRTQGPDYTVGFSPWRTFAALHRLQ